MQVKNDAFRNAIVVTLKCQANGIVIAGLRRVSSRALRITNTKDMPKGIAKRRKLSYTFHLWGILRPSAALVLRTLAADKSADQW